jgi:hypothetical protein
MTAPYPQSGPVVNGLYLTRQPQSGIPAGESVFAALYAPQSTTINGRTSSGPAAEAKSKAAAVVVGTIAAGNKGKIAGAKMAALVSRNADYLRNFYDSASVLKDASGNPIY